MSWNKSYTYNVSNQIFLEIKVLFSVILGKEIFDNLNVLIWEIYKKRFSYMIILICIPWKKNDRNFNHARVIIVIKTRMTTSISSEAFSKKKQKFKDGHFIQNHETLFSMFFKNCSLFYSITVKQTDKIFIE